MVLYPTLLKVALELAGPTGFKATDRKAGAGDETSSRTKDELPAYVAFQGDGDVTTPCPPCESEAVHPV